MDAGKDKRICLYPCYLNSKKTIAEGRKVPKDKGCENPNVIEIFDSIVQGLKLPAEVERKRHPRDWQWPGRVRVQLLRDDGSPVRADIPNRMALMVKVAELVPRHPGRTGKAKATQAGNSSGASGSGAGAATASGGAKKGGKKKR